MHIHFPILLLNYVAEVFIPNSEALSRNKKMFVPVSKFGYIRFPFQFAFVFKLGPMQIMFTLAPANLKYKYNSLCYRWDWSSGIEHPSGNQHSFIK